MDAIELLKKDHRAVEDLFRRFNDGGGLTGIVKRLTGNAASPRQRRQVAERICAELDMHALIEEQAFYPAVRALNDSELQKQLDEAETEHATIKARCAAVRAATKDDDALRTAVASLQECVDHHVAEEEREMFPRVEEQMPELERARVGRELAARKRAAAPKRPVAKPATASKAAKRTVKAASPKGARSSRRTAVPRAKKATKRTSPAQARRGRTTKPAAKSRKRKSPAKKASSSRRR